MSWMLIHVKRHCAIDPCGAVLIHVKWQCHWPVQCCVDTCQMALCHWPVHCCVDTCQMALCHWPVRCCLAYLTGGQTPRLTEHFFEERRLYVEILGDNIECEEMAVNAAARHWVTVAVLVCLAGRVQQRNLLGFLDKSIKPTTSTSQNLPRPPLLPVFLVALCNRADNIYFHSVSFFFFFFFLNPRLISAVGDWMSTILPHMVWP